MLHINVYLSYWVPQACILLHSAGCWLVLDEEFHRATAHSLVPAVLLLPSEYRIDYSWFHLGRIQAACVVGYACHIMRPNHFGSHAKGSKLFLQICIPTIMASATTITTHHHHQNQSTGNAKVLCIGHTKTFCIDCT